MEEKIELDLDHEGTLAVKHTQDVGDILEANKELRNTPQRSDWGRHIASIPNVILTRWLNEEWERGNTTIKLFGAEMDALVARKLRDPEWAFLRTDSNQAQAFTGWDGYKYREPLGLEGHSANVVGLLGFGS